MNARSLVLSSFLRMYRPQMLWLAGFLIVGVGLADAVVVRFADPPFSLWMFVAGSAVKYWLGVVGVTLVAVHLRQFVAAGITRRDFIVGGLLFGVLLAVAFALLVPVGHGFEYALRGGADGVPAGYPHWSPSVAVSEFGHVLPSCLAYLVTGAAAGAGFYRFGAWGGLALLVPALVPVAAAEGLLGLGDNGEVLTRLVPYGVALAVSLLATVLGAVLYHRELRHTAIRSAPMG
ncbi:hypothetical protein COUCH_07860 [Couchioplanes caeruleus]|uniref:hypothetical protein n=1 Tax=Couchioplanes caeruleus TaxID=56438 RepID=UPI0020C04AC2|nr:hypothetical protein [Couchioplanes caeruleus]UQU66189.1 hypothetical protein COUCH_07860 [Couchioplanes caeruleus]